MAKLRAKSKLQGTAYLPEATKEVAVSGMAEQLRAVKAVGAGEYDFKLVPDGDGVKVFRLGWHVGYLPDELRELWHRFLTDRVNFRATKVRGAITRSDDGVYAGVLLLPAESWIREWLED